MINRVIITVLDGFGVGELPDANKYGDEGSNTLQNMYNAVKMNIPNMRKLGLYNIDGLSINEKESNTEGCYGRAIEKSAGKNSPVGHWEISGYIKEDAFTTYPNAFPKELIDEFIKKTGIKGVLANEVGSRNRAFKKIWRRAYQNRISNCVHFCR